VCELSARPGAGAHTAGAHTAWPLLLLLVGAQWRGRAAGAGALTAGAERHEGWPARPLVPWKQLVAVWCQSSLLSSLSWINEQICSSEHPVDVQLQCAVCSVCSFALMFAGTAGWWWADATGGTGAVHKQVVVALGTWHLVLGIWHLPGCWGL
jgi:hypothetical protein